MRRLRLNGIVKLADTVRRELAVPIVPARLANLQTWTTDALRSINQLLAVHRLELTALFPPSRKAYEFLAAVDFTRARVGEPAPSPPVTCPTVRFKGLKTFFQRLLTDLSRTDTASRFDELYGFLRQTSEGLEGQIRAKGFQADHLAPGARAIRGWLAYFSRREHFDAYVAAIKLAKPIVEAALERVPRYPAPVILHFQPQSHLYTLHGTPQGTHLHLPTAMIVFNADQFLRLAGLAFRITRSKQEILTALFSDRCRTLQAQIGELGGRVDRSAGNRYHLAQSFDRVNAAYFEGAIPRPRLIWSRKFTQRVFGHYNFAHDTVMVSRSLDHADVPEFVVDFIMYHELLHKKLGVRWDQNRKKVHPPEFRREMEKFRHYQEAKDVIKRISQAT